MNKKFMLIILIFVTSILISIFVYKFENSRDSIHGTVNSGYKCIKNNNPGVITPSGYCIEVERHDSENLKEYNDNFYIHKNK